MSAIMGAAAMLTTTMFMPTAQAAEPEPEPEPALGSTAFGIPRPTWYMAPPVPLQLQPERARLMLELPREWMPATDLGELDRLGVFSTLGAGLQPSKRWLFHRDQRLAQATIGTSVRLHISDPQHSIDFNLRLMPRAAIAVLRFDPTGRLH